MPLIQKDAAFEALKPYLEKIRVCVASAWEVDYLKYPEWAKVAHDATTRANIIFGHMVERAMKTFIDDSSVKILSPKDTKTRQAIFVFGGKISLRFKKLDSDLMPQNIDTAREKLLNSQEDLPDIGAAYHLVAGYTLNEYQTEIDGIYLVCPNNKKIYWEIELKEGLQTVSTIRDLFEEIETEEYSSIFQKKESEVIEEQDKNGTEDQS